MKKLRILGIVVFVIAAASFGYFKYEQINSKDNQAPVITMDTDSIQVSCQAEDGELLKGIRATDSKDGDVTGSLIVESVSNFMENYTRNMTVVAFDSDNHATKAARKITYTDYVSPTFSLTEPLRFAMNTQDIMGTLTCSDVLDGDITGKLKCPVNIMSRLMWQGNIQWYIRLQTVPEMYRNYRLLLRFMIRQRRLRNRSLNYQSIWYIRQLEMQLIRGPMFSRSLWEGLNLYGEKMVFSVIRIRRKSRNVLLLLQMRCRSRIRQILILLAHMKSCIRLRTTVGKKV